MKQEDAAMIECRDLVAVSPIASRENTGPASSRRLSAAFLTQLIATAKGHPQTRERRRVASEEASRLYATAQARPGRRSLRLGSL